MALLIKNGTLCLEDRVVSGDVLIDSGKIINLFPDETSFHDEIIDATGCYVAPGFIDFHVHLDDRIGPYELADNWLSGSKIAIQNGITSMMNFITQKPRQTLTEAIKTAMRKAEDHSFCDYHWHLTPTSFEKELWPELAEWIEKGFHTVKLYTTYRNSGIFSDYNQIEFLFNKLKSLPVTFLIHCEDDALLSSTKIEPELLTSAFAHTLLRPPEAEFMAIQKIIELAEKYSVSIHVVHVSTSKGAELISEKKNQSRLTCETCPQYLFLSEDDLKKPSGYQLICSPPVRNVDNAALMRDAALSGVFDLYATDHCAFTKKDKHGSNPNNIRTVPNGIPGIGALIPLIFNLYQSKLNYDLADMVRRLSANPAKIAGIYPKKGTLKTGSDADVVIFRLNGTNKAIQSSLSDVYDPYEAMTTSFEVQDVFLSGRPVISGGQFVNDKLPEGQWICQT
jgi:dihydropyrimidinase